MEYPLYLEDKTIGVLRAENDGLRLRVSADCPCRNGLWRAFAMSGQDSLALGVLVPEGDRMTAARTCTLSSLGSFDPESISYGIVTQGSEPQGWVRVHEPAAVFADQVLKNAAAGVTELWTKPLKDGRLIAVPWQPGCSFPMTAVFTLCRVQAINGRCFAVLECGDDGWPRIVNS